MTMKIVAAAAGATVFQALGGSLLRQQGRLGAGSSMCQPFPDLPKSLN